MNALDLVVNHREILKKDLQQFVECFRGDQHEVIAALASKIEWMCITIGSPSSVKPMLESICKGKIKVWCDGDDRGKQLNSRIHRDELERKHCDVRYKQIEGTDGSCESHFRRIVTRERFVKGHFRWNFGAYMCDYKTRDYIKAYFLDNKVDELKKIAAETKGVIRFQIMRATPVKHNETTYTVEVVTASGAEYRFHYYTDGDRVTCNWGPHKASPTERRYVKGLLADAYNLFKGHGYRSSNLF